MVLLRSLIRSFLNNGLYGGADVIQRRRIRLINVFNALGALVIIIFFVVNSLVGSFGHASFILIGLVVINLPVILLNRHGHTQAAKYYLVLFALLFYNVVAYKSVFSGHDRDNGFFLIGFSTIILALFDNPQKLLMFLVTMVSALILKYVRIIQFDHTVSADGVLSLVNLGIGFMCVYFFTDIYKEDLMSSERRIKRFSKNVNRQSMKILQQKYELEASQQLLNTTIDNIPVLIAMLDNTGHFIIVNDRFSQLLAMSKSEVVGKHFDEIFEKEIADMGRKLYQNCLKGEVTNVDYPFTFPSGEYVHVFGKYIPLFDSNNRVVRVLTYAIDIKELKATESELRAVNTSKDKIMSILSHDLRTPINSLSALLQISDDLSKKDFSALIQKIGRQVNTLGFTLNNLLNWVKTQLEGFKTTQQRILIAPVIDESVELYLSQAEQKSILLKNQVDHEAEAVVDPNHFSMVMRNLLNNAIKFTPEGGQVEISSFAENGRIGVQIKDSGIGMSEAMIQSVMNDIHTMEPISTTGTNGEKGTGLGLGFCNDIIKLNKGSMKIESEEGKGTAIKILIRQS